MTRPSHPVALVLGSQQAARQALCDRIEASFGNVQLCQASTIRDALELLGALNIDVVLIDGESSGISGLTSTRAILERAPNVSVVVMSAFSEPECRLAASRAGAMAFVSKRAINSDLINVLEELIGAESA